MGSCFQTSKAKKLGYFTYHDNASHKVDDDAPKSDESDDESNSDKVRFLNRFIKLYWVESSVTRLRDF